MEIDLDQVRCLLCLVATVLGAKATPILATWAAESNANRASVARYLAMAVAALGLWCAGLPLEAIIPGVLAAPELASGAWEGKWKHSDLARKADEAGRRRRLNRNSKAAFAQAMLEEGDV